MSSPVFRFAPSPNGRLHLGHAYSALLNAELARAHNGRFLLRLEDIDPARCTPALRQAALEDLAWLGLTWEEPIRVQSEHMADYTRALAALEQRRLVYPCFCTRSEVAAAAKGADPDGAPLYHGACRSLSAAERQARLQSGAPHAFRLDMKRAIAAAGSPLVYCRFAPPAITGGEKVDVNPQRWGDVILARKDTPTSYHLSVVVDDALQGVTHVVRGKDLEASTEVHVLLQALLNLPTPLYHHHVLLSDQDGLKLAKRRGSESLADLKEKSVSAEEVRQWCLSKRSY